MRQLRHRELRADAARRDRRRRARRVRGAARSSRPVRCTFPRFVQPTLNLAVARVHVGDRARHAGSSSAWRRRCTRGSSRLRRGAEGIARAAPAACDRSVSAASLVVVEVALAIVLARRRRVDDSVGAQSDGDRSRVRSVAGADAAVSDPAAARAAGRRRPRRRHRARQPAAASAAVRAVGPTTLLERVRAVRASPSSASRSDIPLGRQRQRDVLHRRRRHDRGRADRAARVRPSRHARVLHRRSACRSRPAGRSPSSDATPTSTAVIVSEGVARRFWPDRTRSASASSRAARRRRVLAHDRRRRRRR